MATGHLLVAPRSPTAPFSLISDSSGSPVTTKCILNAATILHYHNSSLSYIISHLNFSNTPLPSLISLLLFLGLSKATVLKSQHTSLYSPLRYCREYTDWQDQTLFVSVQLASSCSLHSVHTNFAPFCLRTYAHTVLFGLGRFYLQAQLESQRQLTSLLRDNYHLPLINVLLLDPLILLSDNDHNLLHVVWHDHLKNIKYFY